MNNKFDDNHVAEVIKRNISEALMATPDMVIPSARIISDLHAESIDVADIRFRIEEGLGIRINQREMIAELGEDIPAEEFDAHFTVQFVIDYVAQQMNLKS